MVKQSSTMIAINGVLALMAMAAQTTAKDNRPNVLFMMADQLRWDALGYTGNDVAITPSLDRIASEGLIVKYSWSSTPTCTPARAGLLTGKSPWNHGMLGYGTVAPRYAVELPRMMRDGGYTTAAFGKNHFGWNSTTNDGYDHGYESLQLYDGLGSWDPKPAAAPKHWAGEFDEYDAWFEQQKPGFDPEATLDANGTSRGGANDGWNGWHGAAYVYPEFYHPTAWVGREAVNFLKAQTLNSKPFYAKVSFHRPHSPYDPPARVMKKFNPATLPKIITGDTWDLKFRGQPGDPPGCGPSDADAWCGLMPTNLSDVSRVAYYGSIAFVDEQIGTIYSTLESTGLMNNTFIIFSADHGDGQGDHYHWRKGYPYEFSAHVPMLLRWPESKQFKLKRGTTLSHVVTELRDVFHTAIDVAGIGAMVPSGTFKAEDGKSMLCLLADPSGMQNCDYAPNPGPWRQFLDMEHSTCYNSSNHWNALTDGKMKYVFRANYADEQLFNLTADPGEITELSQHSDYQSELAMWRQRMVNQFVTEGRGDEWVLDGKLLKRIHGQTYSPNYPGGGGGGGGNTHDQCTASAKLLGVGSTLTFDGNDGPSKDKNKVCQDLSYQKTDFGDTLNVVTRFDLCLGYDATTDPTQSGEVKLALCTSPSRITQFSINHNNTAPNHARLQQLVHTDSKQCITGTKSGGNVILTKCTTPAADNQKWIFGTSGRICSGGLGCVSMLPVANN